MKCHRAIALTLTLLIGGACGSASSDEEYTGPSVAKMCADRLGVGNTELVVECIIDVRRAHPDWE